MGKFIVIEGLDGSGKTTASQRLLEILNEKVPKSSKNTFEPNDYSAGGQFIRDVLTKKITDFHPNQLAFSFAANRLDHVTRVVNPWLAGGENRLILSDRYYLSSLVYQSVGELKMADVFELNRFARQPDLTLFVEVSDEICLQRMTNRGQAPELFEEKFEQTRQKYLEAIAFLEKTTGERIVKIDGSGTVETVAHLMLAAILQVFPDFDKN
jgi:dTMP kinase